MILEKRLVKNMIKTYITRKRFLRKRDANALSKMPIVIIRLNMRFVDA